MKLDINQHIRYCLFLFDNCTVNGLGTFRIIESPPVKDHNGNFIKAEKYSISFTSDHTEKPRLAYFISSKENCTEQEAENLIRKYTKNVAEEIALKNEVWFRELGMLIKKDGELRFVSHKFTAKDLKKQVAVQTTATYTADTDNKTTAEPVHMHAAAVSVTSLPPQDNNNTDLLVEEDDFELEEVLETIAPPPLPEIPVAKVKAEPPVIETVAFKEFIPTPVPALQTKYADNNFSKEKSVPVAARFVLSVKAKRQIAYTASFLGSALLLYVFYVFIISGKNSDKNSQSNLNLAVAGSGNSVNNEPYGNSNPTTNGAEFTTKKTGNESLTIPVTGGKQTLIDPLKDKKKDAAKQNVSTNSTVTGNNNAITENAGLLSTPASTFSEAEISKQNIDLGAANKELPAANQPEKTISPVITTEKSNNTPATIVLSQAEFPGGKTKLANYLKRNLVYPESGLDDGKEGTTVVRINVDKNGNVKASEIVNSLGKEFDREIMKVVSRMPKWSPAKQNGESVESSVSFKVEFRYDNKPGQRK
jgi:TonB family protein